MSALSSSATAPLAFVDWGRTCYKDARQAQDALVARRLNNEIGDTLVFTEHEPVYTLGLRAGAEQHLVWTPERCADAGIDIVKTNRGGDITYHGPGQIVGYPIVSLEPRRDLHAYLRLLEQILIETVASFGLVATRREGMTGIWIGPRKVAAIGVAVRRWVAYHGFALNVNADLTPFTGIVPCGIGAKEGGITSLQTELDRPLDLTEVKHTLTQAFTLTWPHYRAP